MSQPQERRHRPHFGHSHGLPVHLRTVDHLPVDHPNPFVRFNAKFALGCTLVVGSMWCAYAFGLLAVSGLPTALKPGNIGLLFWISSDFLQLTLLSVIIVGQNIQARSSDARAAKTFDDAEESKAGIGTALDLLNTSTKGGVTDILDAIRALDGVLAAHQEHIVESLVSTLPPPPHREERP